MSNPPNQLAAENQRIPQVIQNNFTYIPISRNKLIMLECSGFRKDLFLFVLYYLFPVLPRVSNLFYGSNNLMGKIETFTVSI